MESLGRVQPATPMEVIEISSDSDSDYATASPRAPVNKRADVPTENQARKMTYREAHAHERAMNAMHNKQISLELTRQRRRIKELYRQNRKRQASRAAPLPFPYADSPRSASLPSPPGSPSGAAAAAAAIEEMTMPFPMSEPPPQPPPLSSSSSSGASHPSAADKPCHPSAAEAMQEPFPQLPFPPPCGGVLPAALVEGRPPQTQTGSLRNEKQTDLPPPSPQAMAKQNETQTATTPFALGDNKPDDHGQTNNVSASSDVARATELLVVPSPPFRSAGRAAGPRSVHRHRAAARRPPPQERQASPPQEMRRETPLTAVMQHWGTLWRQPSALCLYWLARPLFRRQRTEVDDTE